MDDIHTYDARTLTMLRRKMKNGQEYNFEKWKTILVNEQYMIICEFNIKNVQIGKYNV